MLSDLNICPFETQVLCSSSLSSASTLTILNHRYYPKQVYSNVIRSRQAGSSIFTFSSWLLNTHLTDEEMETQIAFSSLPNVTQLHS